MTLTDPVKFGPLSRALQRTIARFPYYQVHLRRGLFWYYLQRHQTPPTLEPMGTAPVSRIRMHSRTEQLFRVFVRDREIRIDFSHVLTDGSGAFRFLSTMVAEYLRQQGIAVPNEGLVMDPDEAPDESEFADAYHDLYIPGIPKPEPMGPSYHHPGPVIPGFHRTLTGSMETATILATARSHGATLTEFLAAAFIHSLLQIWKADSNKPRGRQTIRLQVPADMRRIHPSRTMRNFSLFLPVGIDLRLGDYSFEDVLKFVHHTIPLELDLRTIRRQISRNVGGEHLTIVRIIPLLLKDWYLSSLHHRLGGNIYSGTISNLGNVVLPEPMQEHVAGLSFVLGPNVKLRKAVSVIGYNGSLNVTIGSVVESRELERLFFTRLMGLGVPSCISEQVA